MLTLGRVVGSAAILAIIGATGFAATGNIAMSKHNLSYTGADNNNTIYATQGENNDELCVYCHTPHASNTGFAGAPLWNKATPAQTFTMYTSTTVQGTIDSSPNAPSKACLSCHDGVSAINSIVNAPGSGNWVEGGTNVLFNGVTTAKTIGTGVTNIGTSLTNDHPVSIAYTYNATTRVAGLKATTTTLTGWTGAATIADLLRDSKVECGSCHDPHVSGTANPTFLRKSNAGSALCIGCHEK